MTGIFAVTFICHIFVADSGNTLLNHLQSSCCWLLGSASGRRQVPSMCCGQSHDKKLESSGVGLPVATVGVGNNYISIFCSQKKYNVSGRRLWEVDDIQ